ncbi:probable sodium/metabolite cotransporter BASS5, chloroplastic isoform X2 [Ricinus communis]|uniref:probable sodium/metabolite cotransporter BASS5, chloroplastic isoform X2 n=1 Tax=Ricinus communis TaxID=3988 RepID=UPI0007726A58|nr:probable sodium/metabolite cotransporter BASS5, chloroplastic isoform X2 [Ricinus communis]|eukprot:XP_015575531.1 probable sodium/metabolite cotransporter BASS5, chloroplastic isoform X2 [Ricinus communis]
MIVNAKQWQIQRPHIAQFQIHNNSHVPKFLPCICSLNLSEFRYVGSSLQPKPNSQFGSSRFLVRRCLSEKLSDSFDQDPSLNIVNKHNKIFEQEEFSLINILKKSNSLLPHVVLASTLLALVYPPSFTWFTTRYYAPALGFLMFAVGVNSSEKDFVEAFKRPSAIFAGYLGQFIVKPILGYIFGIISVSVFNLPTPIGMVSSILQIVVAPIAAGLLLNRFLPWISNAIRPFLPPLSVLVTACCVGAPLAINVKSVISPFGATILSLIISFHLLAFVAGYVLTGLVFPKAPDLKALQRTMSFETGMQSSLLALALANRFFRDPLVAVPPAISTVMMSLMGFTLVMVWAKKKEV